MQTKSIVLCKRDIGAMAIREKRKIIMLHVHTNCIISIYVKSGFIEIRVLLAYDSVYIVGASKSSGIWSI